MMPAAPGIGTKPRIGFIGAGQLAVPLAWALARNGFKVVGAASRSAASAARLADGIPEARAFVDAQALLEAADLIVLAVSDDVIADIAGALAWQPHHSVVHCSGATEVSALAPAAEAGAATGGFHPLQSFTDTEAALRTLPGCTIAIEAQEPLLGTLIDMALALGCHPIRLPAGARALYHAAGHFTAPFIVTLLNEALGLWKTIGLGQDEAVRALLPLMKGTVAAIEANGPVRSLSGPIARADIGTIGKHIAALSERAPDLLPLYLQLARHALPVAAAKGGASPDKLRALQALLEEHGG